MRLIALARLASVTGRWATTVALAVVAFRRGGAEAVGLLGVCRILPAAFAGPLAAGLLGRLRSDRLLLVAGVLRTGAIATAGLVLIRGGGLGPAFVLVGLESLLSTMVRPLQTAALPFLAGTPEELTAANLTLTTIESSGMLLGPLLSGVLLTQWSSGAVLLSTAGAYAFSTLLVARIPAWESPSGRASVGAALTDTVDGFRAIVADPRLRLVVGLYCAENLVAGSLNVLIVVSALQLLDLGNSGVGVLNGAIGAGGVVGALVAAALLGRRRIASDFGLGLVLCGAPLILIAAIPGTAVTLVLLARARNRGHDRRFRGRDAAPACDSRQHPGARLQPAPERLCGNDRTGSRPRPAARLRAGNPRRARDERRRPAAPVRTPMAQAHRLDAGYLATDDAVGLLRAVPIFAPLDLPTLERLARALVPLTVPAGEDVIVQGEAGDRYYVIREGELRVSVDGRQSARSAPGRGSARSRCSATCHAPRRSPRRPRASLRPRARALPRRRGGNPSSRRAADALIDMRLGSFRGGARHASERELRHTIFTKTTCLRATPRLHLRGFRIPARRPHVEPRHLSAVHLASDEFGRGRVLCGRNDRVQRGR